MRWKAIVTLFTIYTTVMSTAKKKVSIKVEKNDSKNDSGKEDNDELKKAIEFMQDINKNHLKMLAENSLSQFNYTTNVTKENEKIKNIASQNLSGFNTDVRNKIKKFSWKSFKTKNATLYRWFQIMSRGIPNAMSPQKRLGYKSGDSDETMADIFENAKVCPYNKPKKKPCKLEFDPDLTDIMKKSRNYGELKYYWKCFRDKTGRKIRSKFLQDIQKKTKGAKANGYKDFGEQNLVGYEDENLLQDMENVMQKIMPIYKQLHAFVRAKLRKFYRKEQITKDGPIPAHILGDMYAQKWTAIYSIVNPYPDQSAPNVTQSLKKKEIKPLDMYMMAESFYTSIGFFKMTPYFWHYSLIEKPIDRKVQCHGTAYHMYNNKDYRIKLCSTISAEIFDTIHHEMGHIEYYMHYNTQPGAFQSGANPGFHEAIGDTILLSVQTPNYLKNVGLLSKSSKMNSKNHEISYLMRMALSFLASVPYNYIIDHYRNSVYDGTIKINELNKKYWEDRLKYQGLCPPTKRTEKDFDIGAKFHIPNSVEYLRYFFANILEFQLYKVLCKEAGHKGELHKCDFSKSKKAGQKFADLLKLGCSKPWKEALSMFTDNKSQKLDPGPILEYFKPLMQWLKKENKNVHIGWKSDNPMECPKN